MFKYTDRTQKDIQDIQECLELHNGKILNYLHEKQFTRSNTPLSSRILNNWTEQSLLDDCRSKKGHGWRKFSTIDLVFIAVLNELRRFGFSINRLIVVKEFLFAPMIKSKQSKSMTRLEFAYMRTVSSIDDGNTYIMIDHIGNAQIVTERDMLLNRTIRNLPESYIYLNLNKILSKAFKNQQIWDENILWLYESEAKLIATIRHTSEKEFKIKVDDKRKITMIERYFSGNPKDMENLHNIIAKIGYGDLNLKISDGRLCYLQGIKQEKTTTGKK